MGETVRGLKDNSGAGSSSRWRYWTIGTLAAAAFLALSLPRLSHLGLYEDEANECRAVAAVRYHPWPAAISTQSMPWMLASYEASLKGLAYGLYLRASGKDFDVASWRFAGLALVALGLCLWPVLLGPRLRLRSHALFLFLMVSDLSIILQSRHEFSPMATGFLLRLLFIAFWMRQEIDGRSSRWESFAMGAVLGLACFEKLISLVWLPLPLLFFLQPGLRKHGRWLGWGFLAGIFPLLLTNGLSLIHHGALLSLHAVYAPYPACSAAGFLARALSLGSGAFLKEFILGTPLDLSAVLSAAAEGGLMLGFFLAIIWTWRDAGRGPARMLSGYALVLAGLYLLPRPTWVHHWLTATPLQYAALAWACGCPAKAPLRRWRTAGVLALVLLRLSGLYGLERSFIRGSSSDRWDPAATDFARFAAAGCHDSLFLAATWGVSAPAACFSRDAAAVRKIYPDESLTIGWRSPIAETRASAVYVAAQGFRTGTPIGDPAPILSFLESSREWRQAPLEPEAQRWSRAVKLWKFTRAAPARRRNQRTGRKEIPARRTPGTS